LHALQAERSLAYLALLPSICVDTDVRSTGIEKEVLAGFTAD
jgi:hypothetical protein